MIISGVSGNEIYCLSLKGFAPGEVAVGNSVRSLGLGGALGAFGKSLAGGEITEFTSLISEGRHAAISRMEHEAHARNASGVTGVVSELRTLAGYTEFLSQGTGVHANHQRPFFSTAASGIELYCHMDAGYQPIRFVMGNVAYALGIGRGIMGSVRTFAQGEVIEFSQMYNSIRHMALERLKLEAAQAGANAVVDVKIEMIPFGPGTIELLMTGTASFHPKLSPGPVHPQQVVTSELSGEELWNLAKLGYAPIQLVMATSVYSLGLAAGIGTMFKSMSRGELPEVTQLIYKARENCLELMRREAAQLGAERVIGNRLSIRELSPGMIEVVAVGTAVRRAQAMEPETPQLIVQAVITERDSLEASSLTERNPYAGLGAQGAQGMNLQQNPAGCLIAALFVLIPIALSCLGAIISAMSRH